MGFLINITGRGVMTSDLHTYVRGAAFAGSDISTPQELLTYFDKVESEDEFRSSVMSLNGYFAVVCHRGSEMFAAVDRARSIPLFYGCLNDEFYMSDDASWVQEKVGSLKHSEIAEHEFCMTGYVTGSDTLYPGVNQLRAGELLVAKSGCGRLRFDVEHYYDFVNAEAYYASDATELSKEFDRVLARCFERLVALANGRTIAVPLSGGWDSRLIALMLTRMGYDNVVAFTYGRPGNLESKISKQVADALGIEWHFVPYTNESWRQWFWSEERNLYYEMAHNAVSVPHVQDWPAVWELKRRELISEDCIFVPGHTGDFLAGTTGIPESFCTAHSIPSTRVVDEVFDGHYSLFRPDAAKSSTARVMRERVLAQLGVSCALTPESAVGLYKKWVWQERQAKFIVNSVRVYEFWGYDWWVPLGDLEMRSFWMHVPLRFRLNRGLYIAYIKNLTQEILDAEYTSRLKTDKDAASNPFKEFVKQTPLEDVARRIYIWLHRMKKRTTDYEQHFLGWYGIMDKDVFQRYYLKGNGHITAYQALHILGKVDLLG